MTGAPTLDILGVPRQALYTTTGHTTAGAYSYPE
jgi:hypothetical protein